MRSVVVAGIGTTGYGVLQGRGIKQLAVEACNQALADAGVQNREVDALYVGNFIAGFLAGQQTLAPQIGDLLGLRKETACTAVEGACSSAGIAFRHAFLLVAAGLAEVVLALGVEKMTHASTERNTEGLALALDHETEGRTGLTFPGFFALVAQRHAYEYGTTPDHLAAVSVKNRANGACNPRACFRSPVSLEQVRESRLVADPLRLFDCCPISDGATAVVLCAAERNPKRSGAVVEVAGSTHTTGYRSLFDTPEATALDATVLAGRLAFQMAGITPGDVDVAELHDCFTIAEIVDSEDLGFIPKGRGGYAAAEGATALGGRIPINPSGGLLAKGHPVGATGLGQIYEIVRQLRGTHENQVADAQVGLAHNLGATGQVCTVHVLRRTG